MLLDAKPKLEDVIVMMLAVEPGSTVQALHRGITRKYGNYSIPAIYQELRKLRERAVCVKVENRYSLRLGWILNMVALVGQSYTRHMNGIEGVIQLPKDRAKETWRFQNLRSLGQFWTQLILVLCSASKDNTCFEWAPHAWFSLSHASEESQFLRAMSQSRNTYYLIVGKDTPLSRDYARALKDTAGRVSFAEGPFSHENRYLSLIGKFLITVDLGQRLNAMVERLFNSPMHNIRAAVQEGMDMFDSVSEIRLTLQHNPARLNKVRRDFCDYFGVKDVLRNKSSTQKHPQQLTMRRQRKHIERG